MEFVNKERNLKGLKTKHYIWFKTGEKTFVFSIQDQTLKETESSIEAMLTTIINEPLYEGDTITFKL